MILQVKEYSLECHQNLEFNKSFEMQIKNNRYLFNCSNEPLNLVEIAMLAPWLLILGAWIVGWELQIFPHFVSFERKIFCRIRLFSSQRPQYFHLTSQIWKRIRLYLQYLEKHLPLARRIQERYALANFCHLQPQSVCCASIRALVFHHLELKSIRLW